MRTSRFTAAFAMLSALLAAPGVAQVTGSPAICAGLPTANQLRTLLQQAAIPDNPALTFSLRSGNDNSVGGLFGGTRMWAAVVNRNGQLCAWNTSTFDPTQAWPGSQAIAKAKAFTANAFSHNAGVLPLSTAQLYTFIQPGHSLFGLNQSNPFNPDFLIPPSGSTEGIGQVAGGIITFGGGVPLYNSSTIVGGLGVSGDTACTDHEIAKRVRDLAGMNPAGNPLADDISYSAPDGPSPFTHPLCPNTFRNETFIGNELPANGY